MVNLPNFNDTPFESRLSGILKGYAGGNLPLETMQKQEQMRLANQKSGIQNQFLPKGLEQEQEQMRLANVLQRAREPHAARYAENEAGVQEAQIRQAGAKEVGELGKMIRDVQTVKQMYGAESPEYEAAMNYLKNKTEGKAGQQFTIGPNGEFSFTQGGSGKGAPPQITGPNGETLSSPTAANQTSVQATQLARAGSDILEKVIQPYVGKTATQDLYKDIKSYEKKPTPELFEKLVDSAVAYKLAPERATVNLRANNVTPTVHAIKKQEEAIKQGWAYGGDYLIDNLPKDIQEAANKKHDEVLRNVHEAQVSHAKRGFPYKVGDPRIESMAKTHGVSPKEFLEDLAFTREQTGKTDEEILAELESRNV